MTSTDITLMLFIALGCYALAEDEIKQTFPEDEICSGDIVTYSCVVTANELLWRYTAEGKTESLYFFYTDPVNGISSILGPFEVVLISTVTSGSVPIITSTATSTNGLTAAQNGAVISCYGTEFRTIMIDFAVPDITGVKFCMNTVHWVPPLCDANCTVSADGQDIGTVPCNDGNLQTNSSDLRNKTVMVTATDEIGNSRDISTNFTSENCTEMMISTTEMSSTQMPSKVASPDASTSTAATQSPAASRNIAVAVGAALAGFIVVAVLVMPAVCLCCYRHRKKSWPSVQLEGLTSKNPHYTTPPLQPFIVDSKYVHRDHKHPITHCAASPDAKYIFTADASGVVRKWEPSVKSHSEIFWTNTDRTMGTSAGAKDNQTENSTTVKDNTRSTLDDVTDSVQETSQEVCDGSANTNSDTVGDETLSDIHAPLVESVEARDSSERELHNASKKDIKSFSPSTEDFLLSLSWNSTGQQLLLTSKKCAKICDTSGSTVCTLFETKKRFFQLHDYKSILCAACNESTFIVSYTTNITKEPLTGHVVLGDMQKPHAQVHTVTKKDNPADVCMSFSHSGDSLVTGNVNGVIKVYEMNMRQTQLCHSAKVHEDVVFDVRFDPYDEKQVFSVGKDRKFVLWNSTQGLLITADFSIHPYPKPPVVGAPKQVVFPSICRSKLFALGFQNEYILGSSEEGGILYKIDRKSLHLNDSIEELTEELIKELRCGKPVTSVDCVTPQDSDTITCVMGFADSSVKVVKLKYNIETQIRGYRNVGFRSGGEESYV